VRELKRSFEAIARKYAVKLVSEYPAILSETKKSENNKTEGIDGTIK